MSLPVIEPLRDAARWEGVKPLTAAELDRGMQRCLDQIDINMGYFGEKFPAAATKGGVYKVTENDDWTDGFWTGMLWLAYEQTGREGYRDVAECNVESFAQRLVDNVVLDHHDLGFLYTPSCVAAYRLTGNEAARTAAIAAADRLMGRWREKGEFFQAWGPVGSREHYRFIIDCLMNIPLLYWASEQTGQSRYRDAADRHFATTRANIIREDGSAFHTFYMDPETGKPDHGATRQGYSDDSSWARGQAWGIYGIPLNMCLSGHLASGDRLTDQGVHLVRAMANYFLNRLPEDSVCYWDLIFTDGSDMPRDSSAAAIAVCGLLELMGDLEGAGIEVPEAAAYRGAVAAMTRSLIERYLADEPAPGAAILQHGVYDWHRDPSPDEGNTWGDYFFMESLVRQSRTWRPYW